MATSVEEALGLADAHFNTKAKEIKPLVSVWLAQMKHFLLTERSEEVSKRRKQEGVLRGRRGYSRLQTNKPVIL